MEIDEITVECGFNYPAETANQIFDIADELAMDVTVCAQSWAAQQHGGKILDSVIINGGPKTYF
jgi:hypothetical protein